MYLGGGFLEISTNNLISNFNLYHIMARPVSVRFWGGLGYSLTFWAFPFSVRPQISLSYFYITIKHQIMILEEVWNIIVGWEYLKDYNYLYKMSYKLENNTIIIFFFLNLKDYNYL